MIDLMKRIMYTGVGLALNTRAEVEAWVKDMMDKGKMSEKDGREFLSDLSTRYDKARADLQSRIDAMVKTSMEKADVANRSELEALKKEIAVLKAEIAARDRETSGETP